MSRRSSAPLPATLRALRVLGANLKLARQRRNLAAALVAERAGMSRPTLRKLESGDPGPTIGALANLLHALGLEGDLAAVARDDELGRRLQDAGLERASRVKRARSGDAR